MNHKRMISSVLFGLATMLWLGINASTQATPTTDSYDLSWYTSDSGGTTFSAGSNYALGGTIGQPDAGLMSGSAYTLVGGFWVGAAANYNAYLPLIWK